MPSQNTKWYKDMRLIEALDQINMAFMSYCYFCGAKSTGIEAVKEKLYSVCEEHGDINKLHEKDL